MNTKKIVLSEEEKKQRLKESKRKYYLKNKEKYSKWNNDNGLKKCIENTNDIEELKQYLSMVANKINLLTQNTIYDNTIS